MQNKQIIHFFVTPALFKICVICPCRKVTSLPLHVVGADHPTHKHLRHVRVLIAPKWYDVGLELLDEEDVKDLHIIKTNHATNSSKACEEMLELWLRKHPEATWSQLIKTLREPGIELNDVASKIEGMLVSSTEGKV